MHNCRLYCQTLLLTVLVLKTKQYLFHTLLIINLATNRSDRGTQEQEKSSAWLHVFQTSPLISAAQSRIHAFDLSRQNFPLHVSLLFSWKTWHLSQKWEWHLYLLKRWHTINTKKHSQIKTHQDIQKEIKKQSSSYYLLNLLVCFLMSTQHTSSH